jgi:ankyrin repeat protein
MAAFSRRGHELVKLLVEKGADVNARDNGGTLRCTLRLRSTTQRSSKRC